VAIVIIQLDVVHNNKLLEREQFYLDYIKPIYNIAINTTSPNLGKKCQKNINKKLVMRTKVTKLIGMVKNVR